MVSDNTRLGLEITILIIVAITLACLLFLILTLQAQKATFTSLVASLSNYLKR